MQKIYAVGIVGKEISVKQNESSVQLDYNVVVKESRKNTSSGEFIKLSTLIRVSTIKKTAQSLDFVENLKAGISIYVEGTVSPKILEKEGRKFTALRMKYSNAVYILGNNVSESFLKMEQIGYIGNVRVNKETKEHVCNFAVAHNVKSNNIEQVIWSHCSIWKAPEKSRIFDFITKGKLVYITGYPRVSIYKTGNGEEQLSLDCLIQNIELLSKTQEKNTGTLDEIDKFKEIESLPC